MKQPGNQIERKGPPGFFFGGSQIATWRAMDSCLAGPGIGQTSAIGHVPCVFFFRVGKLG